ncbi:hypothetical protein D1BOALGB6SA_5865 [Olavius sp. associated proteobacterium Delta 1]|nr:hypothetical protein D1BOALGB6SA_5865 [Olavius sp. associated proteobacterium Delta 1]
MGRKKLNVFSLSFLDIITCGLGAIILLFVLVNAKSAARRDTVTSDLRAETNRIEIQVLEGKKDLIRIRNVLEETRAELEKTQGLARRLIETIKEKEIELAASDKDTLATKTHVNRLKADLKSLEEDVKRLRAGAKAQDALGTKLRPFPGHGDRQYLTDLKMGGRRIMILVDSSASMLADTVVGIIRRRNLAAKEKIKSAKWQQAVKTIDWLTTQLPATSKFQVYTFNETAGPLIADSAGIWLNAADVDKLNQTVARMRKVVPQKGTSLLNAFKAVVEMKPAPDNLFLLTDSLPTMGAKKPWGKRVSGKKRLSLYHDAIRQLPSRIPVNIILYPMEGDPFAAGAFWKLAKDTRGSFFSPSRDWP